MIRRLETVKHGLSASTNIIKHKLDWCTMSPEFDFGDICCKQHDEDYANKRGFWKSNWRFKNCVRDKTKHKFNHTLSWSYYAGVTLFGWIPYFFSR